MSLYISLITHKSYNIGIALGGGYLLDVFTAIDLHSIGHSVSCRYSQWSDGRVMMSQVLLCPFT